MTAPLKIALATPQLPPEPEAGDVVRFECSADNSRLIVHRASANGGAWSSLYDVATGERLAGGRQELRTLSLLPGGRLILARGKQSELLDDGGRLVARLGSQSLKPLSATRAYHYDSRYLYFVDLPSGDEIRKIQVPELRALVPGAHAPSFAASTHTSDGRSLVWLDARFTLHIFDADSASLSTSIESGVRELPAYFELSRDNQRALAIGSQGTILQYDLEQRDVASRLAKHFDGPPKVMTWLPDGRLVRESRFLDVVNLDTGKARTIGSRDPNREPIHAITSLGQSRVAVIVSRVTNPKTPLLPTRFLEIWNVDEGVLMTKFECDDADGPLLRSHGKLFAKTVCDGPTLMTSWRAYRLLKVKA